MTLTISSERQPPVLKRTPLRTRARPRRASQKDPLWYKTAVVYELHVRAFYDSNGDGIGDFRGLTEKLGYLQDLGITAIWLLPFYPSPLKDDGYDIADYYSINPIYGTLGDFKAFLREAHRRGLRVITELVVNHTSDQHPWFQRARRAKPGSAWRNYYVWSDTAERYKEARIIFKDFETSNWTWDPIAQSYYWHRFYSHQPDLNYDHPAVHAEVVKALDFWLDMGVDGVRLDAIPYLYERDGTSCENLPETHAYLKELRRHVDAKYGDRMLLAEANQWPEEAVSYFGSGRGDECHMAFHFPVMPRLFMAVRMEDRVPIIDILEQTPPIPETSQWALFLRNHDELTLEMVTDEERDYMYRVYAHDLKARINLGIRRRLAPLLGNDRKKIELLNLLLFSLPGTPVLYYGDEIGMGDNIFLGDRNGVRTPMHWSSDKNAGFSRAHPHGLYLPIILDPEYHYEAVNVEAQERNPHSLLWWMRRVLALRKRWRAFGEGTLEFLHPENRKVLAFLRRTEAETLLVVANLSRFPQPVELDLSAFQHSSPIELFGRTEFPRITGRPYLLTLHPHGCLWFSLGAPLKTGAGHEAEECGAIDVAEDWKEILAEIAREPFERCLPRYLRKQRWFGGKAREIAGARIHRVLAMPAELGNAAVVLVGVDYLEGDPEQYLVPLVPVEGDAAERVERERPQSIVAALRFQARPGKAFVCDAATQPRFAAALFEAMMRRKVWRNTVGEIAFLPTRAFNGREGGDRLLAPAISDSDQSNSAVIYGDRYILKLFRRLEPGVNPDLEIGRFLTERGFPHVPRLAGAIEYRSDAGETFTLGILNEFIPNAKSAWKHTLDALGRYFERVRTLPDDTLPVAVEARSLVDLALAEVSPAAQAVLGTYAESARLLGQRTGELHLALGSDPQNREFAPEPFTPFYQRSLYQSMRNQTVQNFQLLRRRLRQQPPAVAQLAEHVLAKQDEIVRRFRSVFETRLTTVRIRCHGDFHLGQALCTGKDFILFDFEGEPARPLGERRIKRSALRDVTGMIRSFHYAAYAALFEQIESGNQHADQMARMEPWLRFWYEWISALYLNAYLGVTGGSQLVPSNREGITALLNACLLDKAIYEVGYELNNRPQWLRIPLHGILQILEQGAKK